MADDRAAAVVESVYRAESRRALATLIRLLGDFDLAEEALHEAVAIALEPVAGGGAQSRRGPWRCGTVPVPASR